MTADSLRAEEPSVNSMPLTANLSDRLKRDHAFHRAAKVLADADLLRRGERPLQLNQMRPNERAWYEQTARHLVEIFEAITLDKQPDAAIDAELLKEQAIVAQRQRAQEDKRAMDRSRARVAALERGHELGLWRPLGAGESALCVRCERAVFLTSSEDPARITGDALLEGCLVAAGEPTDPRRI